MRLNKNILTAGALAGVVIVGVLYLYSVFFTPDTTSSKEVFPTGVMRVLPEKLVLLLISRKVVLFCMKKRLV